ncbi:MAG: MarR family winged helix-turn-helix transcriptional regulator [Candidatus Nanopelagicales bacterium]
MDPIAEAERQWRAHGWSDAAPGMVAVTGLTRVQQLLHRRIDALLKPVELTFARYEVLMLLAFSQRGTLPMSVIGSRLQVHPASVTSAVERLERQGFASRERTESDRRMVLARITPAGRRTAQRATEVLNREVFADLGVSDRDLASLDRLLRAVRRHEGDLD